jgi:hypothetical protein
MKTTPKNVRTSRGPVEGPWVWSGRDQERATDWVWHLTPTEIAEVSHAGERARHIDLDAMTAEDFPLPSLGRRLAAVERQLGAGTGFALIRGLPIADYAEDEIATVFCGIGAHLGINVSQSGDGDRLGHVIDRGGTDRYYTRGGALEFHMDPVDVVGLLCLRAAVEGGASRIASAMKIHNIVLRERPDLLEALYRGFHHSRRSHGEARASHRVPVFGPGQGGMECYHLPITVRLAAQEGFALTEAEREALEFVDAVAARPGTYLDMDFAEGDIQFLNNRRVLHARTDYVDHPDADRKRHLLRLWLVMPHWPPRAESMTFAEPGDRAGGGIKPRAAPA